jgi:glycosyltransferase
MKVTIITVCYNSGGTIEETIRSVLGQTHKPLEYIIVDGKSTDNTLMLVNRYAVDIATIVSEPDKGIYEAMNKGVALATGDIVGILNSDDVYADPEVLARVVRYFTETGCDALYGDLDYVSARDPERVIRRWRSGRLGIRSFLFGWMPPHPTFFVKKELYERFGSFNLALGSSADYEFMLRIIHRHKVKTGYIPDLLVKMKMGGASNASLKSRLKANGEDRLAWRLNDLRPFFFTTWLKPVRKLLQYMPRR